MSGPSLLTKNLFALGVIGELVPNIALGAFFQFVYTDILKLPQFYTSTAFTIFTIFKAFLLLTLGVYIGKTSIPLQKLYLFSIVPFSIGTYFIWSPPEFVLECSPLTRTIFLVFSFLLFAGGFTVSFLSKSIIFNAFTKDERTSILAFQQVYFIIGLFASTVLPPIIAGEGWKNLQGLSITITLISSICGLGVLFALPEGINKRSEQPKPNTKEVGVFKSLIVPFTLSSNFFYFILSVGLLQLGFELLTSNFPLVLKYVIPALSTTSRSFFAFELSGQTLVAIAQTLGQIGMLASTGYWLHLTRKKGSVSTWKIATITFASSTLLQYFFVNDNFETFAFLQIFQGASCSALVFLNPLIISEFGEEFNKKKPGACSASQIQGVTSVSLNVAAALRGNINSIVLSIGNYQPGEIQPSSAIEAILVLSYLLPTIMVLFSCVSMRHFPGEKDSKAKGVPEDKKSR